MEVYLLVREVFILRDEDKDDDKVDTRLVEVEKEERDKLSYPTKSRCSYNVGS